MFRASCLISNFSRLKIPESVTEVRELYTMLGEYRDKHYFAVRIIPNAERALFANDAGAHASV